MNTKTPVEVEIPAQVEETRDTSEISFRDLTTKEKRFHMLFYTLASLTGLVVVQVIWQIAVITAK